MAAYCKMVRNVPNIIQRSSLIKSGNILSVGKSKNDRFLLALFSSTKVETEVVDDTPIKFTGSSAEEWKARFTFHGKDADKVPVIQPYAVFVSLAAFLIYFCMLREENDLDDFLREAETKVPAQLKVAVEHAASDPRYKDLPEMTVYLKRLREMEAIQEKSKRN